MTLDIIAFYYRVDWRTESQEMYEKHISATLSVSHRLSATGKMFPSGIIFP